MYSVGRSWAVLKGRLTGNKEAAAGFLSSLSPDERAARNRAESTGTVRVKARRKLKGMSSHGKRQPPK